MHGKRTDERNAYRDRIIAAVRGGKWQTSFCIITETVTKEENDETQTDTTSTGGDDGVEINGDGTS